MDSSIRKCLYDLPIISSHYFYTMKGEYVVPMTPSGGWFRSTRHLTTSGEDAMTRGGISSSMIRPSAMMKKPPKRKIIMSQSMVIDIDPNRVRIINVL